MGRINEAIENYEIALNTNYPSAFVFQSIGRCHEAFGNHELAVKFYLKAIHLEPSNENSWISLIDFFITQDQFKKAKGYFKRALEVNSESVELWKKGAHIYSALDQDTKALNAYQKLSDLGFFELPSLLHHIDLYLKSKQWEKALDLTNEAFKSFPESQDLMFRLGGCNLELGKISEARYFLNQDQISEKKRIELMTLFPSLGQI